MRCTSPAVWKHIAVPPGRSAVARPLLSRLHLGGNFPPRSEIVNVTLASCCVVRRWARMTARRVLDVLASRDIRGKSDGLRTEHRRRLGLPLRSKNSPMRPRILCAHAASLGPLTVAPGLNANSRKAGVNSPKARCYMQPCATLWHYFCFSRRKLLINSFNSEPHREGHFPATAVVPVADVGRYRLQPLQSARQDRQLSRCAYLREVVTSAI